MLSAQASGAQLEPFWLTIYNKSNRLDVRHPPTISVTLGVTYTMAKLRCFLT